MLTEEKKRLSKEERRRLLKLLTYEQELLDAGVQKVIWFITKVKKVFIAEWGKDWITTDWDRDIEVIKGVKLNLGKLLKTEGIEIK